MKTETDEPLYYLEGRVIRKRPVDTINVDGTKSLSMGFPVCEVSEWVVPESVLAIFNRPVKAGEA